MKNTPILLLLIFSDALFGETLVQGSTTQANLIELYTSEACSSCPPADRWISSLTEHPELWQQVVPVSFHVDYWDYIGWKDRFAQRQFSDRQRQYARESGFSTIYTPGLMSNGKEWRNFSWTEQPDDSGHDVGPVIAIVGPDELTISFMPVPSLSVDEVVANIALLGFGLTSDVVAGENKGRKLNHDFVVLDYSQAVMDFQDGSYEVTTQRPHSAVDAERYAIALWVSEQDKQVPLQAAGAWLD